MNRALQQNKWFLLFIHDEQDTFSNGVIRDVLNASGKYRPLYVAEDASMGAIVDILLLVTLMGML
jgi:hypothetical protein